MDFNLVFKDNPEFNSIVCDIADSVITLTNIPKHCTIYDFEDFYIKDNNGDMGFLLESIDDSTLVFNCERVIDLNAYTMFGLKFYDIQKENVLSESMQVLHQEPKPVEPEPIEPDDGKTYLNMPKKNPAKFAIPFPEEPQEMEWLLGFNIVKASDEKEDDTIKLKVLGEFDSDEIKDFLIKKYSLELYDDYAEEEIYLVFEQDEDGNNIPEMKFDFCRNYIYIISFEYKSQYYEFKYIHEVPDIYFSSVKEVKKKLEEQKVEFVGSDFDIKLEIWSISNYEFALAGLVHSENIPAHKKSVLSEYIKNKIIHSMLKAKINSMTFDDSKFKTGTEMKSISVTSYSTSAIGNTPYEILLKALKNANYEMRELERNIKRIFKATTSSSPVPGRNTKDRINRNRNSFSGRW